MPYTIKQFQRDFSDDDACLEFLLRERSPSCPRCGKKELYRVQNRRAYACSCGFHIYPTAGTIFHKSSSKLTDWFFVIYLMSKSNNGVSAAEIQRHLGCTYKTAWRMAHKVRMLMKQDTDLLDGTVEADETYIGGRRAGRNKYKDKIPIMGIVKRGGRVRAFKIRAPENHLMLKGLADNIAFGSRLITDAHWGYRRAPRLGYYHDTINHTREGYVRGDVHTNTIEGFWSQLKGVVKTHRGAISPQHLQSYVDECVFHYNNKFSSLSPFEELLCRVCEQPSSGDQRIFSYVKSPVSS